ncbi:MAG: hypothetical protein IPK13_17370 [Deltaproteobacteria bacterium]|nr:hypothetical protein [Deltaproteobacteria bacterium]
MVLGPVFSVAMVTLAPSSTPAFVGDTSSSSNPPTAAAQDPRYLRSISPEFLDPETRTRFHLTPRASFSFDEAAFTNYSVWSFEFDGSVLVVPGFAVSAGIPFGFETPVELRKRFLLGNITVGARAGWTEPLSSSGAFRDGSPIVGMAAALDVYIPTAQGHTPEAPCVGRRPISTCDSVAAVRAIRPLEPGKYVAKGTGFRARGHADILVSGFSFEGEAGFTSMWTYGVERETYGWLTLATRAAVKATGTLEPFLELGGQLQVIGEDVPSAPAMLTFGLRVDLGGIISPAAFVSYSLSNGGWLFGLDLAGVVVSTFETDRQIKDHENFLDVKEPPEWN